MQLQFSLVSTYLLISCLIRLENTYIDNIVRMDFDYVLVAATIQFHVYARGLGYEYFFPQSSLTSEKLGFLCSSTP